MQRKRMRNRKLSTIQTQFKNRLLQILPNRSYTAESFEFFNFFFDFFLFFRSCCPNTFYFSAVLATYKAIYTHFPNFITVSPKFAYFNVFIKFPVIWVSFRTLLSGLILLFREFFKVVPLVSSWIVNILSVSSMISKK